MSGIIRHNDEWVSADTPVFTASDRLRLGDGVFDTMLVIVENNSSARFVHADLHFERLLNDLKVLDIAHSFTAEGLETIARELVAQNACAPGRYALNTLVSRGEGPRGVMPPPAEDTRPTLVMRLDPVPDQFPPVVAITARRSFRNEDSPLSQIKSCHYGDSILALTEARNKGANEAIMLNNSRHIACATSGNIFLILDGIFYTPPLSDGVLDGITRRVFLQKRKVIEASINMADLDKTSGIYITNSIRGCVPVERLNGRDLPEPSIVIERDFYLS